MKQDVIPLEKQISKLIDLLDSIRGVDMNIPYYEERIIRLSNSETLSYIYILILNSNKYLNLSSIKEKKELDLLKIILYKCLEKKSLEFFSIDPTFNSLYGKINHYQAA